MDAKLIEEAQYQEAATNDAEAAENARHEATMLKMACHLPGHIVSFDASTQTAKVQPGIQRIFREKGPVDLPELVDCPVYFPGGGGFVMTFPVTKGDHCLLAFSDRAIDQWWASGKVSPPSEYRIHDMSDGFAFVGFNPRPNVPADISTSAVELRAVDGSSKIAMGQDGSISIQSGKSKDVSVSAAGKSSVNGSQVLLGCGIEATPLTNGVLTASCICPFTNLPHVGGSTKVLAGL